MNKNNISRTKKIAIYGMLVALAMVLSWVESCFAFAMIMPGMKLGLTNLVVMIALYKLGNKDALIINVVRIFLVSMTFGNMFSLIYSLAGGVLSFIVMIIAKKMKFEMTLVSVLGGIFHNVGQIIVAMIVMNTFHLIYYLLALWISGIVAGVVIGIVSAQIIKRIPDFS